MCVCVMCLNESLLCIVVSGIRAAIGIHLGRHATVKDFTMGSLCQSSSHASLCPRKCLLQFRTTFEPVELEDFCGNNDCC